MKTGRPDLSDALSASSSDSGQPAGACSAISSVRIMRRRLEFAPMDFKSRAVRSLVDLHEQELRRFLDVWDRFVAADAPMPEGRGATAYQSRETLVTHVLSASRGVLRWSFDCLRRPVTDV